MSAQLTWRALDEAGEARTAANRPAFLSQTPATLWQTSFGPRNLPHEAIQFLRPVPKKEIPANTAIEKKLSVGATTRNWTTTKTLLAKVQ